MMPGEREVLERLALELEILNRREELKVAEAEYPRTRVQLTAAKLAGGVSAEHVAIPENVERLTRLRAELDAVIRRRRSRFQETPRGPR